MKIFYASLAIALIFCSAWLYKLCWGQRSAMLVSCASMGSVGFGQRGKGLERRQWTRIGLRYRFALRRVSAGLDINVLKTGCGGEALLLEGSGSL